MSVAHAELAALSPMVRTDLPRVVAIDAAASPRPWSEAAFAAELDRADRHYLVARSAAGGIVGFAGVAVLGDEAHVMTVAVDPTVQGRGIGAQLMAGLLDEMSRRGLTAVTLEVRRSNAAALRLYRRIGFEQAGVRPGYYPDGEDAVIMWRNRPAEVD